MSTNRANWTIQHSKCKKLVDHSTRSGLSIRTGDTVSRQNIPRKRCRLEGADCEVQFYRMLFPINMWCIDGAETASASVNMYNKDYRIEPVVPPSTHDDASMATALAQQLRNTLSRLETMIPGMNCAQWLVNVARDVQERRSEVIGAQYRTEIDALAPAMALLTNQLLVSARWHTAHSENTWLESSSVRWQMFGSGPQLPWAWTAAIILSILVVSLIASASL